MVTKLHLETEEETGFRQPPNNEEAEMRSRIWYYYDIGEHITGDTPKDPDKRMRRAELRLAILSADL